MQTFEDCLNDPVGGAMDSKASVVMIVILDCTSGLSGVRDAGIVATRIGWQAGGQQPDRYASYRVR